MMNHALAVFTAESNETFRREGAPLAPIDICVCASNSSGNKPFEGVLRFCHMHANAASIYFHFSPKAPVISAPQPHGHTLPELKREGEREKWRHLAPLQEELWS